jgi:hypothetical protein
MGVALPSATDPQRGGDRCATQKLSATGNSMILIKSCGDPRYPSDWVKHDRVGHEWRMNAPIECDACRRLDTHDMCVGELRLIGLPMFALITPRNSIAVIHQTNPMLA